MLDIHFQLHVINRVINSGHKRVIINYNQHGNRTSDATDGVTQGYKGVMQK